jgi:hypothetical protein
LLVVMIASTAATKPNPQTMNKTGSNALCTGTD